VNSDREMVLAIASAVAARPSLVARDLTKEELDYTWQERTAAEKEPEALARETRGSALFGARLEAAKRLGQSAFHSCPLNATFSHRLLTPRLHTPLVNDWLTLLAGFHVAFIGDSLLRDLFGYLVGLLAERLVRSVPPNTSRALIGESVPMLSYIFDGNATLTYLHDYKVGAQPPTELVGYPMVGGGACWNLDQDNCARVRSADFVLFHFGAHHKWAPIMPPDFPAGNVDNTTFPFPPPKTAQPLGRIMPVPGTIGSGALVPLGLALDLKERMKHPKTMLWMEYPASHFPWGAGEYEDVTYREIAARTAYTNCAPRSPNRQSSISNASAARLELSERFERAQVPVLRTWNLSWTVGPPTRAPTIRDTLPCGCKGTPSRRWTVATSASHQT